MTVGFECVGDCRVATHFRRVEYANKPKLFAGVKELQTEWNGRTRIKMRTKSDFCVLLLQLTLAATRLLWNDSLLLLISDLKCLVRERVERCFFVQSLAALRVAHWRLWTSRRTSCRHHRLFWLFSPFPAVCVPRPTQRELSITHGRDRTPDAYSYYYTAGCRLLLHPSPRPCSISVPDVCVREDDDTLPPPPFDALTRSPIQCAHTPTKKTKRKGFTDQRKWLEFFIILWKWNGWNRRPNHLLERQTKTLPTAWILYSSNKYRNKLPVNGELCGSSAAAVIIVQYRKWRDSGSDIDYTRRIRPSLVNDQLKPCLHIEKARIKRQNTRQ